MARINSVWRDSIVVGVYVLNVIKPEDKLIDVA